MVKIECLKDYLNCPPEEFNDLATKIYMITDFICTDYPKHREWYFNKQLPAISSMKEIFYLLEIQKIKMK